MSFRNVEPSESCASFSVLSRRPNAGPQFNDRPSHRRRRGSPRPGEVKPVPGGPGPQARRLSRDRVVDGRRGPVRHLDVTPTTRRGRSRLRCDDPTLPTGRDNLVVEAAERLKAAIGLSRWGRDRAAQGHPGAGGAGGRLERRGGDPGGAGSALGPADCPPRRLDALAGEIGSDVAFFRHAPAAICRGRGERVEAVTLARPLHFVLVCPPVGLSTADVYRHLTPPERPRPIGPVLEALVDGRPAALGRSLFNRLQPVAETLAPRTGAGPRRPGEPWPVARRAPDERERLGLFRPVPRPRRGACTPPRRLETLGLGRVRVVTCGP